MEPHPIAGLFPPLPDAEYQELVQDIRDNGQRDPITVWKENGNEWIVDGCSRFKACTEIGAAVKVDYEEFSGDGEIFAFVMSRNMRRRHMGTSQRSLLAAELAQYYMDNIARDDSEQSASAALKETAKAQRVSPRSVASGKALEIAGVDELVALVKGGDLAVNPAELVAKSCTPDEQRALVEAGPKAVRKKAKEIREQKKKQRAAEKALREAEAQAGVKPAEDAAPRPDPDKPRKSITLGADKPQGRDAIVESEPELEPEVERDDAICGGPDCGLVVDPDQCIRADADGSRGYFCSLACLLSAMLAGIAIIDIEIIGGSTAAEFLAALDIPEARAEAVRDALNKARVG